MFLLKDNKGITLVELLAVIAIISILAGMAAISFNNFYVNMQLIEMRDNLLGLIQEARMRSVASLPHAVSFSTNAVTMLRLNDTNDNLRFDASDSYVAVGHQIAIPVGMTVSWNRTTGTDLCAAASDSFLWFDRKGMPRCSNWGLGPCTITIAKGSNSISIVVDRAGKVKYE